MFVTAIIAAGGRGLRFGGGSPKQLLEVGGRAILERSVAAFLAHPAVNEVVVALPQPLTDDPPAYLRSAGKPLRIVPGGARRQDSVANAFRLLRPGGTDYHFYNPFYSLIGGHSISTNDFPKGNARLDAAQRVRLRSAFPGDEGRREESS